MIRTDPAGVKRRIRDAGINLGTVAAEAEIHGSTLTAYVQGRLRNPVTQLRIAMAYARLTGQVVEIGEFWGSIASPLFGGRHAA
ncbi:MAG TPA: hypothetical protein VMZ50_02095 [Phycisphaerae bacterium]|nr:hypothetical protein [Phycisphaerae bacterium]